MKCLQNCTSFVLETFGFELALLLFISLLVGASTLLSAPSEARADSGQDYQQGQLMQRLVKAEEDQARALQQIVRVLERK